MPGGGPSEEEALLTRLRAARLPAGACPLQRERARRRRRPVKPAGISCGIRPSAVSKTCGYGQPISPEEHSPEENIFFFSKLTYSWFSRPRVITVDHLLRNTNEVPLLLGKFSTQKWELKAQLYQVMQLPVA